MNIDRQRTKSSPSRHPLLKRRWKALVFFAAALPICQSLFCTPDPLGALNFETQSFLNRIIFQAVDTIVRNILNL